MGSASTLPLVLFAGYTYDPEFGSCIMSATRYLPTTLDLGPVSLTRGLRPVYGRTAAIAAMLTR